MKSGHPVVFTTDRHIETVLFWYCIYLNILNEDNILHVSSFSRFLLKTDLNHGI